MAYAIETDEFIQILHTGHGHWVTASTIGCQEGEIYVFDSLPPAPTAHLVNQIAALLATQKSSIQVKYVDTTMQCGSMDCGLFAIAFAAALANGDLPGGLQCIQSKMRAHLLHCFETQCVTPFPISRKRRRAQRVKFQSSTEVYCSCRMPQQAGCTMIQCFRCREWYHVNSCVDVPIAAYHTATKWFCTKCI